MAKKKPEKVENPNTLEIYATVMGQVALKNGDYVLTWDPEEARRAVAFINDAAHRAEHIRELLPKAPPNMSEDELAAWLETELLKLSVKPKKG